MEQALTVRKAVYLKHVPPIRLCPLLNEVISVFLSVESLFKAIKIPLRLLCDLFSDKYKPESLKGVSEMSDDLKSFSFLTTDPIII